MVKENKRAAPEHVAIIMDGNGRWAQARGKPRLFGHHAGARRVREVLEACPDLGVKYLTVFAFSTENWKRTQTEVSGLMKLFKRYLTSETKRLVTSGGRAGSFHRRSHQTRRNSGRSDGRARAFDLP